MATEIAVVQPTPMELLQSALSSGVTPEVMRELVALQQSAERFSWEREERQSKIDFDDALNRCQQSIGRIAPNVKRNDTNSWWADYTQLDRTVRPIYTAEGFSICYSETAPIHEGKVRIKAELSRSGISKEYFREITPSTTGPKGGAMATATDADAIAGSRAKRYLILDIFNISMGIDQEEKSGIPEDDRANLVAEIRKAKTPEIARSVYMAGMKTATAAKDVTLIGLLTVAMDEHKQKLAEGKDAKAS
jgi:hypothetical protein